MPRGGGGGRAKGFPLKKRKKKIKKYTHTHHTPVRQVTSVVYTFLSPPKSAGKNTPRVRASLPASEGKFLYA